MVHRTPGDVVREQRLRGVLPGDRTKSRPEAFDRPTHSYTIRVADSRRPIIGMQPSGEFLNK